MKLTRRKLSIITLALVLALCLSVVLGINAKRADASGTITVSSTLVFTASNGASVGGTQVGTPAEGEKPEGYTTFTFADDDDTVSYRRNVAYHWYAEVSTSSGEEEDEEEEVVTEVKEGFFNLNIGFKSTGFEKYIITFESQQYVKTKDGKSKNYVIFYPASDDSVYAVITDDEDYEISDDDKDVMLDSGNIYIEFTGKYTEDYSGGYCVVVGTKTPDESEYEAKVEGKFKNVGGNYAKYSSSSTTPVYPLIFNTVFEKDEDGNRVTGNNLEMILYSFNGQKFNVTFTSGSEPRPQNTVEDNTAPVLCLEQDLTYFKLNGNLSISYQVIDVLRTSTSAKIKYYVLSKEQYDSDKDLSDKELFSETTSADTVILSSDKDTYLPSEADLKNTVFAPTYIVKGGELVANTEQEKPLCDSLVKIYFELVDTSTNGQAETSEVFLDWYMDTDPDADKKFLVNIEKDGVVTPFIAVAKDELGVQYNYDGNGESSWAEIVGAYQAKVTELAKNLSAGSSSYFYLPSPESLFSDNVTSFSDMKFNIYYHHGSKQSSTNLSYNNLSINITKEGRYVFTIYATDAASNSMYYYEEAYYEEATENGVLKSGYVEKDGKYYELKKFSGSDIWTMYEDKELYDKVPWFTFDANYKGVEFEETPGKQSTAYVGTAYTSARFQINGISGSYTTTYKLYVFDSAKYYSDNKVNLSYDKFIEVMDGLFEDPLTHIYFNEIPVVKESDPEYETYKDYGWTGTSTTFTPQEANTFYYIVAEVKDTGKITDPKTCSLAIVATDAAKELPGESDWVKNNVASIVLLVIAGVALIGIVLLIVIKPKNKEDVDVQYEKVKSKKK